MCSLPITLKNLIQQQVAQLQNDPTYDLHPAIRTEILNAIGPSSVQSAEEYAAQFDHSLPTILSVADRIRTRAAILTAQKVLTLMDQARKEADRNFGEMNDRVRSLDKETEYLFRCFTEDIENISAYTVPDTFIPQHILHMAELVLRSRVNHYEKFKYEVNEWWGIYPDGQRWPREYSIKWAATEALYSAVLWQTHLKYQDNGPINLDDLLCT